MLILRASIIHTVNGGGDVSAVGADGYLNMLDTESYYEKNESSYNEGYKIADKELKKHFYFLVDELYNQYIVCNRKLYSINPDVEKIRNYSRILLKINWEFNQIQIRESEDWLERERADDLHNRVMAKFIYEAFIGPRESLNGSFAESQKHQLIQQNLHEFMR